ISAVVVGLVIGALGRLVVPGRQRIPIWLTILVGIVAALVGTALAAVLGVAVTFGVDWIELAIQVRLAALGVSAQSRRRRRSGTEVLTPPSRASRSGTLRQVLRGRGQVE